MVVQIVLDSVEFTYEDGVEPALSNVSFTVEQGERILIVGPAGAGKSTLCRCLNGLIPHFFRGKFKGTVTVEGINTTDVGIGRLSHISAVLFDDPTSQLVCPTVEEEVAFGPENYGIPRDQIIERVRHYVSACRLEGYERRNPHTLSGGQQQACALAAIMAMEPRVFVLDEPTSMLDPLGSLQVYSLIDELAQKGHTLILTENKVTDVLRIVDRILVMNKGRILMEGKPLDILQKADELIDVGIRPPQTTELITRLERAGVIKCKTIPLTLEDGYELLADLLKKKGNVAAVKKQTKTDPSSQTLSNNVVIEAKGVEFTYPTGTKALRGVSLQIRNGQFVAIIGQNGSGKTTLVKHFNALLHPTTGSVTVMGRDTAHLHPSNLADTVGFVFQNPDYQLFATTVKRELEFGPRNLGLHHEDVEQRLREALRDVRLTDDILTSSPTSLSTALKQRVCIASVLTMKPKIIVVDEPTTGQDPKMRREIMNLMKQLNSKGSTVIVITHDMNLAAEYCDRCIVIREGRVLVDGATRYVFKQTKPLQESFLRPPEITELAEKLAPFGVPSDILTVDEMQQTLMEML